MRPAPSVALSLVSLVTALTAGCGSTSGPAKADYIRALDKLCTGLRHQLDSLPLPTTIDDEAVYLSRAIPLNEELLRKWRAMTPPAGDAATIAKITDEFDDAVAKDRVAEKEALTGDRTATDVAEKEVQQSRDKAAADARAYGFQACGGGTPTDQ